MIMLGCVQEATTSAWLTNIRLLAADCLSGRQTIIASKTRPSRHGHMSIAVLCVEVTKPEPTISPHRRVFYLRIFKNMQILKRKLPNLRLNSHTRYCLPIRHPLGNTSAKYGKISKLTRSHFGRLLLSRAQL